MPLQPNLIERFLIRRGTIPPLLLDLGMSTFQVWLFLGAMEIGFFKALGDGPLDVPALADRTKATERGIEMLVEALEPLGYIERTGGRYRLTKATRRSLPLDLLQDMAPFFKAQVMAYADVGRALREDPEDGIFGWEHVQSGEVGRSYQTAMRWLGSQTVDEVVKKVDLPDGARRMLDVGGSHGLYTVAWCRKYPDLRGTVLDWPIGLESARKTLKEHPDVADRIDLVERDFEEEDLPEGYDFAFLGNIIHGLGPDGNRELFGKLARATTERGKVALVDQIGGVSGSKFARGVAALAGFNLFLFSGGRSYPFADVQRWLSTVGFDDVAQTSLRQPGFSLVAAQKTS
ncbi:MAG: hypothetical protein GVY18_00530 [Bacteroidetes bacterium]|jgi:hypothetical protein|nr:hypothetical protein [Bacteroidota bacterium]